MTSLTVWHDGACPLCAREIALMRRLDHRGAIAFVDASDPAGHCPIDRGALLARFHARVAAHAYPGVVLLEDFGNVIARGGAGVVIASSSGYRLPTLTLTLTPEEDRTQCAPPINA